MPTNSFLLTVSDGGLSKTCRPGRGKLRWETLFLVELAWEGPLMCTGLSPNSLLWICLHGSGGCHLPPPPDGSFDIYLISNSKALTLSKAHSGCYLKTPPWLCTVLCWGNLLISLHSTFWRFFCLITDGSCKLLFSCVFSCKFPFFPTTNDLLSRKERCELPS